MGKTDAARTLFQAAASTAPQDYHVWLAMGDFEAREGHLPEAIAAFQKGLGTTVSGEDELSLYRKLGQAQERNLDSAAALMTWQKMTAAFPQNAFALEEAGSAELDAEQYDDARKTFQKLVDLAEPNSMNRVQALMRLAGVDDRQGKTDAAVHGYEAILPLTADSSWLNREIRAQIEQVYRREDDLAGLVGYYQKWVEANPHDVEAILLWSSALSELGKKPEALDALRKVTVLAPDRHEVRQTLAERLVEAKQYDEAITVENALTADDPTEPRYWETLGEALWGKTQPPTDASKKAVLDAWRNIAPADSKDVAAILEVADLCRSHGLNDEALTGYDRALAITPDATDIRERAVGLLVDLHRQDEAWKLLDAMAEGRAATAANDLELAQLDQRFNRADAAAEAIRKGLALEPKNFDLLSLEWSRLAEAQKWPEAAALFDRLLAAAPNEYFIDQVESRQIQALTAAGKLDEVEKPLRARLGGTPPLSEAELRLLTRMMIEQSEDDIDKAIAEAHQRFPQSTSLLQLEVDFARHMNKEDEAVAALRKMIELKPEQKEDWLTEIVRVREDEENYDEALKTAQEIIDASPASSPGYLLYADVAFLAGKNDEGVAMLKTAIKLSDKPNEVRQRLARHDMEIGDPAQARAVYDDAFAAADNPQEKLTIVRAMTQAYFQTGQIDDLIGHFKQEQSSEDGGWRYGLYLSAIYEEMEDYGAARRELAKSLAVRPQDTGLLHSLIGLAEKEGDSAEILRYREMLAEADRTPANELALANEYAQQGESAKAWGIVQANQGEVTKDPLAWKDVLNQISDPEYADKIKVLLESAIRAKGDSFEGGFALAQFQMEQGDLEGAKTSLWNLLAMPLPPAPPAAPTPTGPQTAFGGVMGIYQTKTMQRIQQAFLAVNEANSLLASAQTRAQIGRMPSMQIQMLQQQGVSTVLDPQGMKDRALVYLSAIALQQKDAENFLRDLQSRIDGWHWNTAEKITAYALIQARGPLLDAIEAQATSGKPDPELDQLCVQECSEYLNGNGDPQMQKRAQAALEILGKRVAVEMPQSKAMLALQKIYAQGAPTTPQAVAQRKAAVVDYLAAVDKKDPMAIITAIPMAASVQDWDAVGEEVALLLTMDRTRWPVMATQQLNWLPMNLLGQNPTADAKKAPLPGKVLGYALDIYALGYPAHPPGPSLPGSGGLLSQNMFFQNNFPPPNRYFSQDRIQILQQMYNGLKTQNLVSAFEQELQAREKAATDWRKIYPALMLVYMQWWNGEKDAAANSVRDLLAQDPSDDFRLLLASMLTQQQKYAEAIPVLESVTARYGPQYIQTQVQLLHTARLAKDNDTGSKAALRLLALRLPQQQQMQLADDLRAIGMQDTAQEIMSRQTRLYAGMNRNSMQADIQAVQTMERALASGDESTAVDLAHQLLNRDPGASMGGNTEYASSQAIEALRRLGQLDSYLQDIDRQLQTNPNSIRLNWIAAQAYRRMSGPSTRLVALGPLPQWLKLQRTGNHWEGFYSTDKVHWIAAGSADTSADLRTFFDPKVYVGIALARGRSEVPLSATVDEINFTGKVSAAAAPPPPAPVSPLTSGTLPGMPATSLSLTNAPPATPALVVTPASPPPTGPAPAPPAAASNPLAPWQEVDLGDVATPGKTEMKDGSFSVTGAMMGRTRRTPETVAVHFTYQMLDGDGSLVVRIKDLAVHDINLAARIGLMARESLDSASPSVSVALEASQGATWHQHIDSTPPGEMVQGFPQNKPPVWLKLIRHGNIFDGLISADGQNWYSVLGPQLVLLGPDVEVGFITDNYPQSAGHVLWKDIHVTGGPAAIPPTAASPPVATTNPTPVPGLAAPWNFVEIGGGPAYATPQLTGADLSIATTDSPSAAGQQSLGFVYQTIHGDGEIVGRLEESSLTGAGWPGITFRDGLGGDAPEMTLAYRGGGSVAYTENSNGIAVALQYYRRLAALQPKNVTLLAPIAQQLTRQRKPGEAADIYVTMLKADTNTALNDIYQMEPAFEQAGRLKELVDYIVAWTPPPPNPMGGIMPNTFQLTQLAGMLRQNGDLPEAERVYRKILSLDTTQSKDDAEASLVQILLSEGRRDDAVSELEKYLTQGSAPAPAPLLGSNYNFSMNNATNWMFSMSWNQDGPSPSPRLRLLELAHELGDAAKLKTELQAAINPSSVRVNGLDPNQMMILLLAIVDGDKDVAAQIDKFLKDQSLVNNFNTPVLLIQAMEPHPALDPIALKLAQDLAENNVVTQNPTIRISVDRMTQNLADRSGNRELVMKTLQKEVDDLGSARAINVNYVSVEQDLALISSLLGAGMVKEAQSEVAAAQSSPQMANNPTYKDRLADIQAKIDFAQGKDSFSDVAFGVALAGEKGRHDEISWCLASVPAQHFGSYMQEESWSDDLPVKPTEQTLVVQGGADENHLTTIASFPHVASRGTAPLKIPPGTAMLRAELVPKNGATVPAVAPAFGGAQRATVLVGTGDNLLLNPDLAVTKSADGVLALSGWDGLSPDSITVEKGGPWPDHTFRSLTFSDQGMSTVAGNRVAIQPGACYLFTGWLRSRGNAGLRFLDASGKVLETRFFGMSGDGQGWHHGSWLVGLTNNGVRSDGAIPAGAAFLQLTFQTNQKLDVAGLSLRSWPPPAAVAASGPASASR
jgi:tetratricopeptide (TPR) repeat protein